MLDKRFRILCTKKGQAWPALSHTLHEAMIGCFRPAVSDALHEARLFSTSTLERFLRSYGRPCYQPIRMFCTKLIEAAFDERFNKLGVKLEYLRHVID